MDKINLPEKAQTIVDAWNPRIAGELNGQHIKLARFQGPFIWHLHEHEDEAFYVLDGGFTMEFRDRSINLGPGDLLVVPRGVEHRPVAEVGATVLLFEPATTRNTGSVDHHLTRTDLERI